MALPPNLVAGAAFQSYVLSKATCGVDPSVYTLGGGGRGRGWRVPEEPPNPGAL